MTSQQLAEKKAFEFFCKFKKLTFGKGTVIIDAGVEPKNVFYIASGKVKMCMVTPNGDEIVLNIYRNGTYFPMHNVLASSRNEYYFEAMQKTAVHVCPKEKVTFFLQKNCDVTLSLLKRVFSGLHGVFLRTSYLMAGDAYLRAVAEILIETKRFGSSVGAVELSFSLTELATFSGLTRETFSRQVSHMKKKNLIYTKGSRLYIYDIKKLEDELSARSQSVI